MQIFCFKEQNYFILIQYACHVINLKANGIALFTKRSVFLDQTLIFHHYFVEHVKLHIGGTTCLLLCKN